MEHGSAGVFQHLDASPFFFLECFWLTLCPALGFIILKAFLLTRARQSEYRRLTIFFVVCAELIYFANTSSHLLGLTQGQEEAAVPRGQRHNEGSAAHCYSAGGP